LNESQRGVVASRLETMKQSPGINQYTKVVNANLHEPEITRAQAADI